LFRSLLENHAAVRETVPGDGRWVMALLALVILVITHIGLIGAAEMSRRVYVFGRAKMTERTQPSKE
jgi:hypothetical protein